MNCYNGCIVSHNIYIFSGLDKGECDPETLARFKSLIPASLWQYLDSKLYYFT